MSELSEDPRDNPWHPRFCAKVVGHEAAMSTFRAAFTAGKPHHAWLITGPSGIGKASLAYHLAREVMSESMAASQVERWVKARAHPDFAVLERSLNDQKPRKIRSEISVEDVRGFIDVFGHTSGSGGWRVGLVDTADDLNNDSANALLKLVEEPPSKTLILLVCHAPGKLLRTLRSRCRTLPLHPLSPALTLNVLKALPLEPHVGHEELSAVAAMSQGSPGVALQLLHSAGAKAFQSFLAAKRLDAPSRNAVGQHFANRATATKDFEIFMDLLTSWLARKALQSPNPNMATLYADLLHLQAVSDDYNLDRRTAVMDALARIDRVLKAA